MSQIEYKVVELTTVTDESIEETLNRWSADGWQLDTIQFAMRESSKRPAMAFVLFTRSEEKKPDQQMQGAPPTQSSQSSMSR